MTSEATRRRIEGVRPAQGATTVTERIASGQDDLNTASTMGLLTAAYALTHRLHEGCPSSVTTEPLGRVRWAQEVRAQRDAITAEVLRRADA